MALHSLYCAEVPLRNCSLTWFAFSGADIECDFVLMTSAYSQYLKNSYKQYLALTGS